MDMATDKETRPQGGPGCPAKGSMQSQAPRACERRACRVCGQPCCSLQCEQPPLHWQLLAASCKQAQLRVTGMMRNEVSSTRDHARIRCRQRSCMGGAFMRTSWVQQ